MTTIRFFYDIVSPYSYLAFEVLHRYQSLWNLNIVLEPIFLAGIMQGSGNAPLHPTQRKGRIY
jgi:glutathione S-transferase kappa 1